MATGYDGSIRIDTRVNTKGFNTGVKSVEAGLNKITGSLGKMAAAVGVAFSVTALVKFGKQAVDIASDLAEVENVVTTAFGNMSDQVDQWAKSSIKNFGMSELSAKRTASTYMAMNAGMGLTGQTAADMALRVAERTADIASFYNMTQEEADTMLKSIWTGETESLKRIGVVMTQTNLDAYALANGINKTTSEMTQAEQVQLRYAYVMEQTRLASGDFAKTQDSWANQTRILSEQWKQFLGILGNGIIQVLTPLLQALNAILSTLIKWASVIASVLGWDASQLADSSQEAAQGQEDLADAVQETNKQLQKQTASIDELNILNQSDAESTLPSVSFPSSDLELGAGTEVSNDIDDAIKELQKKLSDFATSVQQTFGPSISQAIDEVVPQVDRFKQNLSGMWSDLQTLGDPLKEWINGDFTELINTMIPVAGHVLGGLMDSFNTVFSDIWNLAVFPMLQKFITTGLPVITQFAEQVVLTISPLFDLFKTVFDNIWNEVLAPFLSLISTVWNDVWDIIKNVWDEYGVPIFEALREAIDNIKDTVQKLWNEILKPIFDNLFAVLGELWEEHLQPLVEKIAEFAAKFAQAALAIYNSFIKPIVDWLITLLGPVVTNVINGVVSILGTAFGAIADILSGVFDALGGLMDFITGVFTGDWEKAWSGIKDFFGGIWNAIWGLIKGVINLIIDALNLLWRAIYGVVSGIVNGIGGIAGAIGGLFGQDWSFSMPSEPPLIPKLATGAVIPPNQQFAAILGDQKHGRNLEAPESLLRQIVREEGGGNSEIVYLLQQLVDMTRDRDPNVTLEVDGRKLAEAVERGQKARGVPIFG